MNFESAVALIAAGGVLLGGLAAILGLFLKIAQTIMSERIKALTTRIEQLEIQNHEIRAAATAEVSACQERVLQMQKEIDDLQKQVNELKSPESINNRTM
jgi:cell division protein FtsL